MAKKKIFEFTDTPAAVYTGSTSGIKGLITVKANSRGNDPDNGGSFLVAILSINGEKAANAQMTANLKNEAYYTLFGDKMTTTQLTCLDIPGYCGNGTKRIKRLYDCVRLMDSAIASGNLPSIKVTYRSAGDSGSVVIKGYLTNISFGMAQQFHGSMVLTIQGYVS